MTYTPFRHIGSIFRKKNPIHLTFFVTKKCNALCPFCFYLSRNGNGNTSPELSLDEIERMSRTMGRLLWLAFSGGEVFLREDIAGIANAFYRNNGPAIILLPTNGLMSLRIKEKTEEILRICKKSTIVVKLSLDGPEKLHDSLRGVNGAFQKTMESYRMLEGLLDTYPNFELGVNTVFCSRNQDVMDETIRMVRGMSNIRTHTVSLVRGDVSDGHLKEVNMGKYFDTIAKLESDLKSGLGGKYNFMGARIKAAQDIVQRRIIYKTVMQNERVVPCYAGTLNLVITETGDVYSCESFRKKMGNVRESGYDIKKVLRTDDARAVVRSIKNNDCSCTNECYMMTNILFNPALYPSVIREYIKI